MIITANKKQIPRDKLLEGFWYAGRGRNANFGLWTGTYFLTIGSSMGSAVIKHEAYYIPKAECIGTPPEESWGTFQPFLALDDGDVLEFDDESYGYAKTLKFPSKAGKAKPDPNWTLEGQKRLKTSAKRALGRKAAGEAVWHQTRIINTARRWQLLEF